MSSFIFQAISWHCLDYIDADNNNEKSFIVKGFGRTTKNKTISVNIYEYTPHFYIKFNSKIEKFTCEYIKDFIKSECGEIDNVSSIKKKDFYGFVNGELSNFIRLKFKTNQGYRSAIKILQKKVIIPQVNDIPIKYKLYESNLEPYLRMFHIKKILPSGWIKIPNGKYFDDYNLETHCNINIGCIWSDISGIEKDEIAPFKIASFDIECSSFDGSFPQASKKYTKLAYELLDKCKYLEKEDILKEIIASFDDKKSLLSKSNNKRPLDIKKLKKGYLDIYNSIVDPDLNYCLSDKLDKVLPPLNGDAIIQIGTTTHLYGEQECSYKNIITLGTCDDIEGADVIQCENEIELLMQWRDLIIKIDPDIITGYNIFGFDFSYIVERAKELKIYDSFSKLGRIKDKKSEYVEKTLSSSALGDNLLKYIDIDGRVIIDMMKLIQRDHKLDYYKLDFVANHFIGLNKNDVTPQDIFRLQKGSSADRKTVAEYCFVQGTRVSLSSQSVDIKCLENMNTDVITWVEDKGFSTSQKTHFFNNGKRDCIEITLIDGTKISCTKDHRFLTKDGWIEAQALNMNNKILCYPEPAFIDYDSEKLYTFEFSKEIGVLDYDKSCIFTRVLGYMLTDGGISQSTCYKNYSSGRVKYIYDISYVNLGTKIDAINMQQDIFKLIGKSPAIKKEKYTYRITFPTQLTKWFLSVTNDEKGKKISNDIYLPEFIKDENCPIWIVREFLKGIMGGDGSCTTFNKTRNDFNGINYTQSKLEDNVGSLLEYMDDIKKLFELFDIEGDVSNVIKNGKGDGYTVKFNIKRKDIVIFYEKIGYAYCIGKSYKLAIASSYYKLKKETDKQFKWICKRVDELRKGNMTIADSLEIAKYELQANELIFNKNHSLPNIGSLNLKNYDNDETCRFRNYSPSVEDYLKLTESYDRFVTDNNTKSHAVDQEDTHSPCYYLSILGKKDIGEQTVYDIEVKDTHNFVANGMVVHNCIQDCALCNRLIMKLETIANNIGMANVCIVPLSYIFMRGQGIKIFSLVSKECRDEGFIIPTLNSYDENKLNDEEGYEGAIVLEPKVGIYIDEPIAVLDYASLYPSSMISENISHDTIILDEKYNNIESYEYVDIKYDLYEKIDDKKVKKGEKTVRFVQTKEKGVIPKILMKLLQKRKETRKKMTYKTINDKFSGLIFENDNIVKIKDIHGEIIGEMKKSDIISTKDTYDNFQKAVLDGLQLAYKVTANSIYGQCGARTSSIYLKDLAACTTAIGRSMIVKAKEFAETKYNAEIIYGDSVTADTPVIINIDNTMYLIDIDELDQIINNNWQNVFHYESNDYKEQLIVNQDMMIWTDCGWSPIKKLIKHFTYKKIYRISTSKGSIDVTEDHSLVSKDKEYIKPDECIINETELLHSFPSSENIKPIFMQEYGENIDPFREREYKSKSSVQLIYTIGKKKGYNNMKIIEEDGIFNIIKSNDINDKLLNMRELDNKEGQFVYDIETEIGRFHCGIGELIVKNTDSIFLKFKNNVKGKGAIIPTINKAKELVKNFRPLLKPPHDLEYEKIYYPFIIFSKKRYCANKYENDDVNFKLSYMGIALKRRDNANIVKKIYGGVLDIILNEQDIKKSINFLKKSLVDLINDKYDLEDLVITKSIKSNYKDPTKIAHKVLSMRMMERDSGNIVQVNDRIRYIYVQTKEQSKKLLQGDMIEDIDYVKQNKLKPNYEFYITNQIMKPIAQLYSLVLEDLEEYKKSKDHFKKMEKTVLEAKNNNIEKTKDRINTLREKEIQEILFKKFIQEASIKGSQTKLITSYFMKK
jgi:DNA polymerase elongation subunit (family B)/intein/homing endonuclease